MIHRKRGEGHIKICWYEPLVVSSYILCILDKWDCPFWKRLTAPFVMAVLFCYRFDHGGVWSCRALYSPEAIKFIARGRAVRVLALDR